MKWVEPLLLSRPYWMCHMKKTFGRIVQEGYPVLAFASNLFFSARNFLNRFLQYCMTNSQTSELSQEQLFPMKSRLVKDYIIPSTQDLKPIVQC